MRALPDQEKQGIRMKKGKSRTSPNVTFEEIQVIDFLTYRCWLFNIKEKYLTVEGARRLFKDAPRYEQIEREGVCLASNG